jgi:hypothetical protein
VVTLLPNTHYKDARVDAKLDDVYGVGMAKKQPQRINCSNYGTGATN